MNIVNEYFKDISIVFMRRTGAYGEENYKLMEKMKEWVKKNASNIERKVIYAIAQDNPECVPPQNCRYDVCFVIDNFVDDTTILHGKLPEGKYSVITIDHTAEAVKNFWSELGHTVEQNKLTLDVSRPILERYDFSLVEKGLCEFCIPTL